ncbi:hypothetical protein P353_18040 [Comamonas testosteroni]|uniref:Uncharacterized protein n=2 Tax=Comamonas testosteroni TaxID=285 RepID=A0A096FCT2_COMTE|nr:hypothetical protein P353_18040 [Comamonas testosteroni]
MVLPGKAVGVESERGSVSIFIYGLNRLGLVQERTRLLRRLEFLGDLVIELGTVIQEIEVPAVALALQGVGVEDVPKRLRLLQDKTLREMREMASPEAPYSAMVRAWLRAFKNRLS